MDFHTNLMTNLTAEDIRSILTRLGVKKPTRKGDMAKCLHDLWNQTPQCLIEALSEPERLLLSECAHTGDTLPDVAMLNAKHGFSYSIPHSGGYRDAHVILCFLARDGRRGYELVDDVSDRLARLLPPPPPLKIASVETLPAEGVWTFDRWGGEKDIEKRPLQVYELEAAAPTEVKRILQLAGAEKLRVSDKTGFPTPATQKIVRDALCAPEMDLRLPEGKGKAWWNSDKDPGPVRAFAWPVLMQQCGWAAPKAGKLRLTRKGKAMLAGGDDFEHYVQGVQSLLGDSRFDELRRVSVIKGQRGRRAGHWRVPVEQRRHVIQRGLAALPRDQWVTVEEAYRVLFALGENGNAYTDGLCLYICDQQYGHLSGEERDIGRIYFRQLLGESFATLGLVDLGYAYPHVLHPELHGSWGLDDETYVTRFDGVKYLRVTPLGRFCFGVDRDYEPPEAEQRSLFKVLPTHEIVVTDGTLFSVGDSAMIERFAKRKSDAVWKMDRKSILEALEAGDTPEDILKILRSGTDVEIPETVVSLLEATAELAGAATGRQDGVIVEFRDEETATLIAHDTAAAKVVLCREGRSVVVYRKKLKAFQTALRRTGILLP